MSRLAPGLLPCRNAKARRQAFSASFQPHVFMVYIELVRYALPNMRRCSGHPREAMRRPEKSCLTTGVVRHPWAGTCRGSAGISWLTHWL